MNTSPQSRRASIVRGQWRSVATLSWLFAFGCANNVVLGEHVGTTETTGASSSTTTETAETPASNDDRSSSRRFDGGRPRGVDDDRHKDGPWDLDGGFDARFPDDQAVPPFLSDPHPIIDPDPDPDPIDPRPGNSMDRPPEPPLDGTSGNFGSEFDVGTTDSTSG